MNRAGVRSERIIELVRKRPALYDPKSSGYGDAGRRKTLWDEVAAELYGGDWEAFALSEKEALVKEVNVKWKSLRDTYSRVRREELTAEMQGGPPPHKRRYIYYDQLSFLDNYRTKRFCTSIILGEKVDVDDISLEFEGNDSSNPLKDDDQEPEDVAGGFSAAANPLQGAGAPPRDERQDDRLGNKKFLLSLVPFLDKMPDDVNLEVRIQLMSVLQTFTAAADSFFRVP